MADEISVNTQEFINQLSNSILDGFVIGQLKRTENCEPAVALYKLLNKYGIHGNDAVDFLRELAGICEMTGGNNND
jgi:hypothetical protein